MKLAERHFALLALGIAAFPQCPAVAEESRTTPPPDVSAEEKISEASTRRVFSVFDDNDFFGRWSDKYYTNHTRLALTLGASESPSGVRDALFFSLGQEIYSPKDREARVPDPRDHPYAGYLYASFGDAKFDDDFAFVTEIQLGATGDWSLAEKTQKEYHRLIDEIRPAGWDTQIHERVVAQATGEVRARFMLDGACGNGAFGSDLVVRGFGDLGNLRGVVSAGAQLRAGLNLPWDFGATTDMRRGTSVVFDPRVSASFYAYLDASADVVLWDKTLTSNNDRGADICAYPLAGEISVGVCAVYDRVSLAIFQSFRSKDFTSQDKDFFAYGGFRLSVFF